MKHSKISEIKSLVEADIAVLLTGERGSGKTTICMQVAEMLELKFYSISMTRQTTLSHLLGFVNVNGKYIPSQLYFAATEGGLFLIDEIDGGDANVLLTLNTIENGFITFPEGVVELHKDFRLIATANPQDQHEFYVGRNKLDAATLDRFDIVNIDTDKDLERSLVDNRTYDEICLMRKLLKEANSSKHVSMRDTIRFHRRKALGLSEKFAERIFGDMPGILEKYHAELSALPKFLLQEECETVDDLILLLKNEAAR